MLAEAGASEKRCVARMTQFEEPTVANATHGGDRIQAELFKSLSDNNLLSRTPGPFLAQCLLGLWPAFILDGFPEDS
jgi:hypothetical protein